MNVRNIISMRFKILFTFLLFPLIASAQFIGLGTQYADARGKGNAIQFAANIAAPVWGAKNEVNTFIASGIDYTGGSSPVAGLNIQPIRLRSFLSSRSYTNSPFTILAGLDTGYLFNFKHGRDGIIITPNAYIDYKFFFVKTGWDFNVTGNRNQFYVRAGVCIGIKSFDGLFRSAHQRR